MLEAARLTPLLAGTRSCDGIGRLPDGVASALLLRVRELGPFLSAAGLPVGVDGGWLNRVADRVRRAVGTAASLLPRFAIISQPLKQQIF